jgi:hypothetical protein
MAGRAPGLIAINHDDYHARYVGQTANGRQFFLTTPFDIAAPGHARREFLACYLFDGGGKLLEARVEEVGEGRDNLPPGQDDAACGAGLLEQRLAELGGVSFCNIKVAPFRIERFGLEFGLIAKAPQDNDNTWRVTVEPGDYMEFYPPWDGEYDTWCRIGFSGVFI